MVTKRQAIEKLRDDLVAILRRNPDYLNNDRLKQHFDFYSTLSAEAIYEDVSSRPYATPDLALSWLKVNYGLIICDEDERLLFSVFAALRKECDVG